MGHRRWRRGGLLIPSSLHRNRFWCRKLASEWVLIWRTMQAYRMRHWTTTLARPRLHRRYLDDVMPLESHRSPALKISKCWKGIQTPLQSFLINNFQATARLYCLVLRVQRLWGEVAVKFYFISANAAVAVAGLIIVERRLILLIGNPPFMACVLKISSFCAR